MSKMRKTRPVGRQYYDRQENTRIQKQTFLIVCEGTKTEPNYFKAFRVLTAKVLDLAITGVALTPLGLVEEAVRLKDEDDYDQVWVVFDRDDHPKQDFKNALSLAKAKRIQCAYSNQCFELWYILHYQLLNSAIGRDQYWGVLSTLIGRTYKKNDPGMYLSLVRRQATAIHNAKMLKRQYARPNPEADNPSTTVYSLVEELNKFV